ncbi:MAG: hypothetical protein ACK55K_03940 [Bacteroidota bacterium]
MKKSLFLLFASFSFIAANAQTITSKKGEAYLPEKGDWAISVNADGLFKWVGNLANSGNNNNAPSVGTVEDFTFVGKKFVTDKNAIRVLAGFRIGNTSNTWEDQTANGLDANGNPDLEDATDNTFKQSVTDFSLKAGLGKEWRRGKTRLQGYYGADLYLSINSRSEKWTNSNKNESGYQTLKVGSGLGLGLGANAFIGAEYFLFPKMSIGAQYEDGFNLDIAGAQKATVTPWSGSSIDQTIGAKSTSIGVGPVGVASIRLTLHF